jgi:hypothetical protein
MATQTIEFRAASGLTLTAELFAIGSDTIVATVSPIEQTNRAGTYRAAYTDVAAGEYQLVAFSGTTPVASWLVTLTLDTATFQTYDRATSINMRGTDNALLAASYTAPANSDITAIKTKTDQFVFTVANQVDANALTGGGGLDAAGVRAAVGLASANLDTQLADLPTVAEFEARTLVAADYFVVSDYTAPLDASGVRSAIGLSTANLDTQLADLPTNAEFEARTIPSADYFVVGDYTTPPTASSVADEVQTRTIARVTLVDTCTTNTDMRGTDNALLAANYTTPPTASANASQVRTELTTELGRIDATISSRSTFAGGAVASVTDPVTVGTNNDKTGYALATAPPTASEVATQVRTELSTELARIDATVSSRSTLTAANVWEHATRSLTTFGTLVSDIWSNATRTLTAISDSSGITTLLGRIAGTIRTSADDVTAETAQTAAVRSGLALEATLTDIKGAGFATGTDSLEAISDAIAATSGSLTVEQAAQLTAIKAKTDLITSQTANQTRTPVNTFAITRGDTFTGTQAVTTNYTGYTATFTIRHRITDAVLCTASATVTSSTVLTVALTTTNTAFALLVDPAEFGPHPYDIRLVNGAIEKTERGIAVISRDMTRA